MKLNLAIIISVILAVGTVTFAFTWFQISNERERLNRELEERISFVAQQFIDKDLDSFEKNPDGFTDSVSNAVLNKYRLLSILVFYNNDSLLRIGRASADFLNNSFDYIIQASTADTVIGNHFADENHAIYQFIKPVNKDGLAVKTLVFYTPADYIDNIIAGIWLRNFLRWFIQALLVSFITILVIRWGIFSPINKIVDWVKAARLGNVEVLKKKSYPGFLKPLHTEIAGIALAMQEAKLTAEEEARLRANAESVWTPERLKVETGVLLNNRKLIVVSNREPYVHIHEGRNIKCIVPASGLITAMEPILKACGGLWIATGSGDADKEVVDVFDKIQVPPDEPKYTLRRLWQSKEEEDHFYYGFSNEGLWPLCHIAHTRPVFRKDDWAYYNSVNQKFADAVIEETMDDEQPFILIQDYHFALLPLMIKKKKPDARVAIFWHIPWPNPESFGICPWQKDILLGMLGADLIGFHTQYHCNHFLETVNDSLESRVLWESFAVKMSGHSTLVKPFPISIAFTPKDMENHVSDSSAESVLSEYGISASRFGIGVDRIDYTKGIIEKFLAIEKFFEMYPEYIGNFVFVQVGAPSRTLIKNYADMVSAVEKEAERINHRFKQKNWKAILLLKKHHSHEEIKPFYRNASLCMVTSLHDGMNLVAKEFVAERSSNNGVLILSRFAGASQKMQGALVVNPYDIDKTADAIKMALEMPEREQELRMKLLRQEIVSNNIYYWAADLLRTMSNIN